MPQCLAQGDWYIHKIIWESVFQSLHCIINIPTEVTFCALIKSISMAQIFQWTGDPLNFLDPFFLNFLDLPSLVNTVLKILFMTNNSLITIMLLKSAELSKSIYHKTYL